jgi:hypothetical protein
MAGFGSGGGGGGGGGTCADCADVGLKSSGCGGGGDACQPPCKETSARASSSSGNSVSGCVACECDCEKGSPGAQAPSCPPHTRAKKEGTYKTWDGTGYEEGDCWECSKTSTYPPGP